MALANMAECGTASILDITEITETPQVCAACPVAEAELIECFGTTEPTEASDEQLEGLFESIERGEARYVVLHGDDGPTAVLFVGYSFD